MKCVVLLVVLAGVGCVRPEIAVVSRQTALERQAAGEYPEDERALEQAALNPGPDMLPRDQIAASGAPTESVMPTFVAAPSDLELLDALLVSGCIGEANDGLLVPRQRRCDGDVDEDAVASLVSRYNVHRRQIWSYLRDQSSASIDEARVQWRVVHLRRVVCGASVQNEDGTWETKSCE